MAAKREFVLNRQPDENGFYVVVDGDGERDVWLMAVEYRDGLWRYCDGWFSNKWQDRDFAWFTPCYATKEEVEASMDDDEIQNYV
jgi:hypothetical protein